MSKIKVKHKKVTLKGLGYLITGRAIINLWGGGQGEIVMDQRFIPYGELSHNALLSCVNDGRFGCESIESANVSIYIQYELGFRQFDREISINNKVHTDRFSNSWPYLSYTDYLNKKQ